MYSIALQHIHSDVVRATCLAEGRVIAERDGHPSEAKKLLREVMKRGCWFHKLGENKYDMTYIRLNAAAEQALVSAE